MSNVRTIKRPISYYKFYYLKNQSLKQLRNHFKTKKSQQILLRFLMFLSVRPLSFD
jgi:hypothetical protein